MRFTFWYISVNFSLPLDDDESLTEVQQVRQFSIFVAPLSVLKKQNHLLLTEIVVYRFSTISWNICIIAPFDYQNPTGFACLMLRLEL